MDEKLIQSVGFLFIHFAADLLPWWLIDKLIAASVERIYLDECSLIGLCRTAVAWLAWNQIDIWKK
jgi:hypothetical protein